MALILHRRTCFRHRTPPSIDGGEQHEVAQDGDELMIEVLSDPEREIDLDRTQLARNRVDAGLYDDLGNGSEVIQTVIDALDYIVSGERDVCCTR